MNNAYLRYGDLKGPEAVEGLAWLNTGTQESLLQAGNFIETIEQRQGLEVGCFEEIEFELGNLTAEQLLTRADAPTIRSMEDT